MGRRQFRAGRAEVMVSYGKRYALRSLTVSEGMGRASSARLTGMDRRTLRDGVHRDNAEGIAGLCNRPTRGRKPKLTEGQTRVLKAVVLPGPDPAVLLSQRRAQLRRNGFRPIGISSALQQAKSTATCSTPLRSRQLQQCLSVKINIHEQP